jgi:hypothetical protein
VREAAQSWARCRCPTSRTAGTARAAPASSSHRPIVRIGRSLPPHKPNRSANADSETRSAVTAYTDSPGSRRARRYGAIFAPHRRPGSRQTISVTVSPLKKSSKQIKSRVADTARTGTRTQYFLPAVWNGGCHCFHITVCKISHSFDRTAPKFHGRISSALLRF